MRDDPQKETPFVFLVTRRQPTSTLFPYTTLFRSRARRSHACSPGRWRSRPSTGARKSSRYVGGGTHEIPRCRDPGDRDRKSTRLNSSHPSISYAVFCLKKKKKQSTCTRLDACLST